MVDEKPKSENVRLGEFSRKVTNVFCQNGDVSELHVNE